MKNQKETMRIEAKRARGLLVISASEYKALSSNFFDNIEITKDSIVAAYWSMDRELDTHDIIDELLGRDIKVALPVIQKDSRILKFANFTDESKLVSGAFGVSHPVDDDKTSWLSPDVFIVPMLAFDRKGARLGFGGGYYDATLKYYKEKNKDIVIVGLAYAQQACLFNLPVEDHDINMDLIITQQGIFDFRGSAK